MIDALEDVICCPFCGRARNCEDDFEPIFIGIVQGLKCTGCGQSFSVVTPSGERVDKRRGGM